MNNIYSEIANIKRYFENKYIATSCKYMYNMLFQKINRMVSDKNIFQYYDKTNNMK